MTETTTVLRLDASMRHTGSVSRQLTDKMMAVLKARHPGLSVDTLDLAKTPVGYVDETWIGANFTPAEERGAGQTAALAGSDALVERLKAADILVLGVPIYNFGVPAAFKAWIDQVCRARVTFRYTPEGPEGLLTGKTAYVGMASGGTELGSPIDHASGYIRFILGFMGITDVTFVAADQLMVDASRADAALARVESAMTPAVAAE